MDDEVRTCFGPLGRMPDVVINGPSGSGLKWKALHDKATKCLRMRDKQQQLLEAERINKAYADLVQECKEYVERTKVL